jgi:hypothetical protein
MMTVYGFGEERMTVRKTCAFSITISERDGEVHFSLSTKPLNGDLCLHRDEFPALQLQEETDELIMQRDDMFFKNLDAVEHTLTAATFDPKGV